MYVQRNSEACSHNHCCRGKAVLHILSACLQPLVIWHAKRMRRIVLSTVDYLAVPYCSTISHKRHGFRIKILLNKTCYFLYKFSKTSIILRRIQRDIVIKLHMSSCKEFIILIKRVPRQIFEKYSYVKLHGIPSSGRRLVARGQTDG